MAEVTGLVIGAISLASLFDSVVNNFDRIQVGRELDETHQRYLLQLEVLRLRLNRWRDAVGKLLDVDDPTVKQADGNLVKRHLIDIQNLFEKEEKLSRPYKVDTNEADEDRKKDWMVKSLQYLSRKHRANAPSIRSQVRWAIRGKKEFGELVADVSAQMSNLEKIIPTYEMERYLNQMRSEDANEIGKQPEANINDVRLLEEIASAVDQKFADVVNVKAANEWVGNIAKGGAMLHQGDLVSNDYHGTAIAPSGRWERNVAEGKDTKVTQGTSYGFNPWAKQSTS